MLICQQCGADNPVGRVFCEKCGKKLDLADVTADSLVAAQVVSPWRAHLRKAIVAAVVVVLIFPALALWPKASPIGKTGTQIGARRVEAQLKSAQHLPPGQTLGFDFTEQDINGYIEFMLLKRTGLYSFGLVSGASSFAVRATRTLLDVDVGKYRVGPMLSYDLVCVPAGGRLIVASASIGHLPLLGPFKSLASGPVHRALAGQPEWLALPAIQEIKIQAGAISVVFKK